MTGISALACFNPQHKEDVPQMESYVAAECPSCGTPVYQLQTLAMREYATVLVLKQTSTSQLYIVRYELVRNLPRNRTRDAIEDASLFTQYYPLHIGTAALVGQRRGASNSSYLRKGLRCDIRRPTGGSAPQKLVESANGDGSAAATSDARKTAHYIL